MDFHLGTSGRIVTRKVWTISDWLSVCGGFFGSLSMILATLMITFYDTMAFRIETVQSNLKIRANKPEPLRLDLTKVDNWGEKEIAELIYSTQFRQIKHSFCKMVVLCVPNWIKKNKFKALIDKGNSKLDMALDIRTLIKTTRTVSVLRKILLNKRQKLLSNLTKFSYLGSESSSEKNSELTEED